MTCGSGGHCIVTVAVAILFIVNFSGLGSAAEEIELSYLTVIGHVTETTARVLFDVLNVNEPMDVHYELVLDSENEKEGLGDIVVKTETFTTTGLPLVLKFDELEECSEYWVQFFVGDKNVDSGNILTKCAHTFNAIVISCDRYLDDHDNDFVLELHKTITGRDTFFHIGDQLYLDSIFDKYGLNSFHEVFPKIREAYHLMWNRPIMRTIMRSGSHIMEPDDHDVFNALSPDLFNKFPKNHGFIKAAHIALMYYQVQLFRDVNRDDVQSYRDTEVNAHYSRAGVGVFMLDVRYHRSHAQLITDETSLLGQEQLDAFINTMEEFEKDDSIKSVLVVSNMPLMYPNTFFAQVAHFVEGDLYPMHPSSHNCTDTIITHMQRVNKIKPVTLVGGDFHMGSYGTICERVNGVLIEDKDGERNCIRRIISSGITIGSAASTSPKLTLYNSGIMWTGAPTIAHKAGVSDDNADAREWVNTIEFIKLVNTFVTIHASNGEPINFTLTTREPLPNEHITQFFLFDYGFILVLGSLFSFIYQYIRCFTWLLCSSEKELAKEEEDKKGK
eukprot:m.8012 g.8012  ORF g.8012 m.8012 type:complete len:558 (-) comp2987_c0_seq1:305-1978(-)